VEEIVRFCLSALLLCLLPGCVNYTDGLCIPHVDTFCYQGQTYWLDSCDRVENVLEDCECGCRADQSGCRTCGEKECEEDADCPEGFFCDRSDWLCKPKECTPECEDKCCGPDGCGGTCPDTCPMHEICNTNTCRCEGAEECRTNADCPPDYWCDRTVWRCRPIDCIPNCTGKCCGDDGCGGTCLDFCPSGYSCNAASCQCEAVGCQTNADCTVTQCCLNGLCTNMSCGYLECGPDPVCGKECGPCPRGTHCDQGTCVEDVVCTSDIHCAANECCLNYTCVPMACGSLECGPDPVCGKECGPCPSGSVCNNGRCVGGGPLCQLGQECVDITGGGFMGCLVPPNNIPPENPTGCAEVGYCDGNFFCHCTTDNCSESACVENCGTCPADLICVELWADGLWGCLTPDWQLPPNPPYCDGTIPCQGNSICYTDGTNNFCLENCSSQ
jgi:hypothetical protein